jgi:D-sedoheptulose 7-phosphate isomerase
MSKRAVFLDRDGVINRYFYDTEFGTVDSPATPDQFVLLAGVGEAIAEFNRMGLLVVVVSNQPGIAKGRFSRNLLDATTQKMKDAVRECGGQIDAVYYCLHHPDAANSEYRASCDCRKPAPGMFLKAARDWDIDLTRSYTVGDGVGDILAGEAVGTTTIFLSSKKSYVCNELDDRGVKPTYYVENLRDAVPIVKRLEDGEAPRLSTHGEADKKETASESYTRQYLDEAMAVLRMLDVESIERMAELLATVRERGGRLFLLGVGGGAGHASHAVCDFRKICGIEAYSPSDNVSELTARVNDDGWETSYASWLRGSRISAADAVLVFSVGGGDLERNISANLVRALQYTRSIGAAICGVVGRDGGFTARVADACVLVRVPNPATVTAHTEAFQALVWHLLVSHPQLKASEMKWESTETTTGVVPDLRAS